MPFLGELAALGTASCWAGGSLLFTRAARRVGSFTLNHARITLALILLAVITLIAHGSSWAAEIPPSNWIALVLSGILGLSLGDWAYFRAFVLVGPRLTTLLMTLAPPFTAVIAIPVLGETIGLAGAAGMSLTLCGVIWVTGERHPTTIPRGHLVQGVVFATLGSLGQAVGLVLSKIGMGDIVDPLPATAIRMAGATAGVWFLAATTGRIVGLGRLAADRRALVITLGATVMGPVLGVWLSLVAVRHTYAGIAATLMATTPVIILPLVVRLERERVSARAVTGAIVAVAGVAILFLR